jgi:hypothetical protein
MRLTNGAQGLFERLFPAFGAYLSSSALAMGSNQTRQFVFCDQAGFEIVRADRPALAQFDGGLL